MLQVITGKFFTTPELYRTMHRRVLYSNARLPDRIETRVGTLTSLRDLAPPFQYLYEVEEKLEAIHKDGSRSILAAVGHEYLVRDFASVAAFFLRITLAKDAEHVRRLVETDGKPVNVPQRPSLYVRDVFDAERTIQPAQVEAFITFLDKLLGLPRKHYEGVMKAVRRLTTGLDRVEDDIDVAYTMLVASIESLAQDFDEHVTAWSDIEEKKRRKLDKALEAAEPETVVAVQNAVIEFEHAALSRRYRAFALKHIGPNFYRQDALSTQQPINAYDLPKALEETYQVRSKYVHTLKPIPDLISRMRSYGDAAEIDGKPVLNLQGMSRVAREVIVQFVDRQPKVEFEDYDYRSNLPNIMRVPLAEQCWIHFENGYGPASANQYLGGFLNQLAGCMTGTAEALTDIRDVLGKIERIAPGLSVERRRPMLVLYQAWNYRVAQQSQLPGWEKLINRYSDELFEPSIQTLVLQVLYELDEYWSSHVLRSVFEDYKSQRHHKGSFRMPPLLEAATALKIANRCRVEGHLGDAFRAVTEATEVLPGHRKLIRLESVCSHVIVPHVHWPDLLLTYPHQGDR